MKIHISIVTVLVGLLFLLGLAVGFGSGRTAGAEQMARHLLNPKFHTDSFVGIVKDQSVNAIKHWKRKSQGWEAAASHYGGICKWLIEGKPIYGPIVVGSNATLSNCLLVTANALEINGESATVMNCEFRSWDMGWVKSLDPVDPNEVVK